MDQRCLHTRRLGTLASPPPPVRGMPSIRKIDTREDAKIHKAIACKYPSNDISRRMASWFLLPSILLFFNTLRPREKDGSSHAGNCIGLLSRTLAFLFALVTGTFASFNATHSLSILDHCSCSNSPVRGVKVSQSVFLICTPLHHCLQSLKIGYRYLLMNVHVVQFQYGLELRRLTYSQFVRIFQDVIGWYF